MTQKERVLNALKAAGGRGIRSDVFIRDFMPRAAARVQELRDEGWDISSEREEKYTRWTLNVGSSTEGRGQARIPKAGQPTETTLGVASGVADEASSVPPRPSEDVGTAPPDHCNPYEYEVWAA